MSRGTWSISTQTGSAGTWEIVDTIYIPNENMEMSKTSTFTLVQMADGSRAGVSPETKYNLEPITMTFLEIVSGDSFKTKIEGYVENQTYVRITDHLGGTMTGIFTAVNRVWISGVDDTYDFQVIFTRC
jgi:hypothetical protein